MRAAVLREFGKPLSIETLEAPEPGLGQLLVRVDYSGFCRKQLEEIAKTKMPDLTAYDMDQAVRIIAGSAQSMGIETEGV